MPQTAKGKSATKKEEVVQKPKPSAAKSSTEVSSSSKAAGGGPKTSATTKPTTTTAKPKTSLPLAPPKPRPSGGSSAAAAAKAASAAKASAATTKAVPPPPPTSSSNIAAGNKRQYPTPSSAGSASKKRPYRRTKRPKNYCDKSTVTTTTPTAQLPVNVFDAVLGECEDLLRASVEAQQLGRLKIASAYQLLLHTRLVGLGKRFDRSTIMAPPFSSRRKSSPDDDDDDEDDYEMDYHDNESPIEDQHAAALAIEQQNAPPSAMAMAAADEAGNVAADATPSAFPAGLEHLTSVLPSNIEMDASMMEHLARAAVELHHQRTGRKKSADGLLASPMTGLIGTPTPPPTTASAALSQTKGPASGKSTGKAAAAIDTTSSKVAWTQTELNVVNKCLKEKKQPYTIAKLLPSKTEAQVKAYIKNQQKMTVAHVKSAKKSLNGEEMDGGDDDHDTTATSPNSAAAAAKKRGGRGRKPPTTAMNTVPNANLDAKSLLQGALEGRV